MSDQFIECCVCGTLYQQWGWNSPHCQDCVIAFKEREYIPLHQARVRARRKGLPMTLTMREWLMTIFSFQGKCAYCREAPYTTLEHFIPIAWGGGTTQKNCVPSCRACNVRKGTLRPNDVTLIPRADMERVRDFLAGYS